MGRACKSEDRENGNDLPALPRPSIPRRGRLQGCLPVEAAAVEAMVATKKEGKLGAATTQSMLDESCERSDEEERVSVGGGNAS